MSSAITIAIILLSVLLGGCQKRVYDENTQINEQNRARIEEGRYTEAIQSLKEHLRTNPYDNESRLLLASALVARSGIKLRDFYNLIKITIAKDNGSPRSNGIDDANAQLEWEISFVFKFIDSIPEPTNGTADISQAIDVLHVPGLTSGRYLYRAILKLVLFKYNFSRNYHMRIYETCKVRPKTLHRWFTNVEKDLQDILNDILLSQSDAQERENIRKFKDQLREANQGIKNSLEEHFDDALVKLPTILKKAYPECS